MINKEKLLHAVQSLRNYRLHHFAFRHPKSYFLTVLVAALAGYGFLLFFPILTIVALTQLVDVAQSVPFTINTLSEGLVWFAVFIIGIAISHHILTVKFDFPKEVELPAAKAPKLFELIEHHKDGGFWLKYFRPKFRKVLLSEHFTLEIYKTPVIGIPLWSKNTLVIGFPVMQTLPEHYFAYALQRKLIQYAKGRNIVSNWLYQLRYVWFLYPKAFSQRNLLGEQVIAWFFKLYAPLYKKISLYAAQQEELAADTMALGEINDSDLFKTIQSHTIAEYFFHSIYLPMLTNFIKDKGGIPAKLNPYTTLPVVFRKTVDEVRFKHWLEKFQQQTLITDSITPAFSQRMRNMGQARIRMPKLGQRSAAEYYFGNHYSMAAQLMDKIWRNKINQILKQRSISDPPTSTRPHMPMKTIPS
jgi:hypothetical protein